MDAPSEIDPPPLFSAPRQVIDFIGADYFARNINSLKPDGRLVLLGFLSGAKIQGSLAKVIYNRLSILGSTLRSRDILYQSELIRRFGEECLPLFKKEGGGFEVLVHEEFGWEKVGEAHDALSRNENVGKYVLTIS